jgi:two-component system chemotaxis response regulator CheB
MPAVRARSRTKYRDTIVIGASAGGLAALSELARELPAELPASLFVAQHSAPASPPVLPEILDRAGSLPAKLAVGGEQIERGQVYVAPPDHHLMIGEDRVRVSRGPRENGHRPAVDPLFRSAARSRGAAMIAVVLSGALDDGTAGLLVVKARGGIAIVQSPEDALHTGMPSAAIRGDSPDHVVDMGRLPGLLCDLVQERLPPAAWTSAPAGAFAQEADPGRIATAGVLPVLTCPECGGPLSGRHEDQLETYRCRVGHRYSITSLEHEQARELEATLWATVRGLPERAGLLRRLAAQQRQLGAMPHAAGRYEARAATCEQHADAVRTAIEQLGSESEPATE